jgi:hypothetical protein
VGDGRGGASTVDGRGRRGGTLTVDGQPVGGDGGAEPKGRQRKEKYMAEVEAEAGHREEEE